MTTKRSVELETSFCEIWSLDKMEHLQGIISFIHYVDDDGGRKTFLSANNVISELVGFEKKLFISCKFSDEPEKQCYVVDMNHFTEIDMGDEYYASELVKSEYSENDLRQIVEVL